MKICKKIVLLCGCMITFLPLLAQDTSEKKFPFYGYSGGMMLHTGYLSGGSINLHNTSESVAVRGVPLGIGGTVRFHLGNHLRVGMEGYGSTFYYGAQRKSFVSLGWGGLLMDCQWKINRAVLFCGGTIGGGRMKNVAVLFSIDDEPMGRNALYQKHTLMLVTPFIGVEYALNSKIHWITKVDCIVNLTNKQSDFAIGPRVYTGIVFLHARKRHK